MNTGHDNASDPAMHGMDATAVAAQQCFAALVESVGVKRFAAALGLSTRQVNRVLSGAQPNPIERVIQCLQSADPAVGDEVLDYICQEMGGHFVRHESMDTATVNAVKECAEAIAAISDGDICPLDVKEIREAISALSALIHAIQRPCQSRWQRMRS